MEFEFSDDYRERGRPVPLPQYDWGSVTGIPPRELDLAPATGIPLRDPFRISGPVGPGARTGGKT